MSTFVPATVDCPACGRQEEAQLAESLNVTRSPAYRQEVLDRTFQRFTCAACGHRTTHMLDFVYFDFDAKLYVGVLRPELATAWRTNEEEPAEAFVGALGADAPGHAREIGIGFTVRTVFGLEALREKVVADEAGIDDVDLELLKLRLLVTGDGLGSSLPRLGHVEDDVLHLGEGDGAGIEVARDALDDLLDPAFDGLRELLSAGPWVDAGRVLAAAAIQPP